MNDKMMPTNVVSFRPLRTFTAAEINDLQQYTHNLSILFHEPLRAVFGRSDEGDEYCVIIDEAEEVKAHFAKDGNKYIAISAAGFREGKTLNQVLLNFNRTHDDKEASV
jgi:hypothetical protein